MYCMCFVVSAPFSGLSLSPTSLLFVVLLAHDYPCICAVKECSVSVQISENGVVSFREAFPDAFPRQLPLPTDLETPTPALIAGFWGDINVRKNDGAIFFTEMDSRNNNRFGEGKARVLNHLRNGFGNSMEEFDPTHIFLVTWEAVHPNDPGIARRVSVNLVAREVHVYSIQLQSLVYYRFEGKLHAIEFRAMLLKVQYQK